MTRMGDDMEPNQDRSLISRPSHELTAPRIGQNRILGEMVEQTLALGRKEAVAQTARFRIGDYALCEPDYRQILLWADALKMEPVTVIGKLVAGEETKEVATRFQDGRMLSLSWNLDELPLSDFRCIEGLSVQDLDIRHPSLSAACFSTFLNPKRPLSELRAKIEKESKRIALRLPSLRRLHLDFASELNLSDVPNLTELRCAATLMRGIDLSQVPNLTTIDCGTNQLMKLDLSRVPNLTTLDCAQNQIAELDLSHVSKVTTLDCSKNQLRDLDLSHIPNLTTLDCSENQLRELDLSNVQYLTRLPCRRNQLVRLDLSRVPNLTTLDCAENRIDELDLSHVPNLTFLRCAQNQIGELDLSHVPNLTSLRCAQNQLVELDIRPLRGLNRLSYDSEHTRLIQRPDQQF